MTDRLMTYPELGEFLGRSEEAARQLAKRRRWRRVISNDDGRARVSVPVEFLEMPRPPVDPRPEDEPEADQPVDDQADVLSVVAVLRDQVDRLTGELDAARTALDVERVRAAQVDVLKAIIEGERTRYEDARAAEARRVEDLKAERDRWAAQADRLIPLAEAESRPRPWWSFRRTG